MKRILTIKERKDLIQAHRNERDGRIRDRMNVVLGYDEGYSYSELAKILLLDDETIRRHTKDYLKSRKLTPANGGSTGKLNESECRHLTQQLSETTYLYVKDSCARVKKTFKKNYSIRGMTKWLHAHRFCYKKQHAVPAKVNKAQQEAFIQYYRQLKENTRHHEPIYFVDSVHPQHQTRLAYGWILRGERKTIATTGRQYRLNVMGGICLSDHKMVDEQSAKVNEASIQSFLSRLRKQHPGRYKVHVIWDNAGYHRSQLVRQCAEKLGIEIHYLPPYSPNLNPIERLWKIMHEHVTYNRYYPTFSDFTEAIQYFFRHIGKKKKLLRSRITDNFQLIDTPNFAS